MTVSFGGIASGLDSNNIVRQLTLLARQPIRDLQTRQRELRADVTDISNLTGKIQTLESFSDSFADIGGILFNQASSSNEDVVTAIADGGIAAGSYELNVQQLARPAKFRSTAFADSQTVVPAGRLSIGVFDEDTVEIEIAEGTTLGQLRDAINASGARVDASIIDTGNGVYLNVTSEKSGHTVGAEPSTAMQVTMSPSGGTEPTPFLEQVQGARNAIFELEGLTVERPDNVVNDAIDGLTFDLKSTQPPFEKVEIVVTPDREKIMEQLEGFVDAYNSVVEAIKKQSDSSARRRTLADLRTAVTDGVSGAFGGFPSLSSFGIESNSTGRLTIDRGAMGDAIESNPRGLASVFAADDGVAGRLTGMIERYTASNGGIFSMLEESLESRIRGIDDQIERKERYVDAYTARIQNQFNQLEILTVRLQDAQSRFASFVPFAPQNPGSRG